VTPIPPNALATEKFLQQNRLRACWHVGQLSKGVRTGRDLPQRSHGGPQTAKIMLSETRSIPAARLGCNSDNMGKRPSLNAVGPKNCVCSGVLQHFMQVETLYEFELCLLIKDA
jgi:hypothetical protein